MKLRLVTINELNDNISISYVTDALINTLGVRLSADWEVVPELLESSPDFTALEKSDRALLFEWWPIDSHYLKELERQRGSISLKQNRGDAAVRVTGFAAGEELESEILFRDTFCPEEYPIAAALFSNLTESLISSFLQS